MFLASKIFWLVAQPLSFAFLSLFAGLLLMLARFRRSGGIFGLIGLAVLFVSLFTTTGSYFLQILENRFARPSPPPAELSCIIVLGGAFENVVIASRGGMEFNQAAERFVETLRLARAYPAARIVVSGGDGSLSGMYEGDARASEAFFQAFDIGTDRLIREEQSRTTFENARYTKDLLAANRLEHCALVTSAYHMPRSIGLFRSIGVDVIPWPTDYRTTGQVRLGFDFTQPSLNAQLATTAAKEWTGLFAYYLLGRTQTILPNQTVR
ncbi:YdcF family protein [Sinorhizobium numidicum]|uniref:YdcF family protein n=1 Tax=Sinorhizobium numidicum TaxID=680248 RepID=A0ABY8D2F8_9HYPH|nr:YdcF family protein [Sinorhizobium numidicum]WEX77622.1 YdcF family protein [Sinorhizobium numidicum]WEX84282.1 YdcF family protein [Sinorhizobium numidicum]